MTQPLRLVNELTAQAVVPPEPRRRSRVESWLGEVLAQWQLQPALAGRWLTAADGHLRSDAELTVCAAYDTGLTTFTLEIWSGNRRLYGIDDWLG